MNVSGSLEEPSDDTSSLLHSTFSRDVLPEGIRPKTWAQRLFNRSNLLLAVYVVLAIAAGAANRVSFKVFSNSEDSSSFR